MTLRRVDVAGYRSIRSLRLDLDRATVVVGANGSGKTNLYKALHLLHAAARGELARTLAEEGGMPSALWAGELKAKEPRRVEIAIDLGQVQYMLTLGLVPTAPTDPTAFRLDPSVKSETVTVGRAKMFERGASSAWGRGIDGERVEFPFSLDDRESVLSQIQEPHRYPELSALRQTFLAWRFYHHFRTDPQSPIRSPQVGVRTVALSHDGGDLAAALQTIVEIGDEPALREAIGSAFPGSSLEIVAEEGRFGVRLLASGLRRALDARELSDGTLRYLCLVALLLAPRAPSLLALNEPETSLHPSLLAPLGELIARASKRSQIVVTTHAEVLAVAIGRGVRAKRVTLRLRGGATVLDEDDED